MAKKRLKHGPLMKILRRYGVEEDRKRAKGSHRLLIRRVDGQVLKTAIKFHRSGQEYSERTIEAIRRSLRLTPADGVSDDEFYGR